MEVPGLQRLLTHVHPRLCVLDIGGNGTLGGPGGILIREYCLRDSGTLRKLVCDANELGDDGIMAMAMGTAACESLEELNLENNDLTGRGAKVLILNPVPNLTTMYLQDNMDLPESCAKQLKQLYKTVLVDDDLPEEEEEKSDDVVALTNAMAAFSSHI
jgi:hypothetical protein